MSILLFVMAVMCGITAAHAHAYQRYQWSSAHFALAILCVIFGFLNQLPI